MGGIEESRSTTRLIYSIRNLTNDTPVHKTGFFLPEIRETAKTVMMIWTLTCSSQDEFVDHIN